MQVTALYAGLCGILLLLLSARVVRLRLRHRVGIGVGQQPELERAVRVQGNFTEYVPLVLLLLALLEYRGGPAWALHAAGAGLLVGRLLHATGLSASSGTSWPRAAGVLLTWTALLGLSIANVVR
jgi:hypothetical protein